MEEVSRRDLHSSRFRSVFNGYIVCQNVGRDGSGTL